MDIDKFFLRSRRLRATLIPFLIALGAVFDVDTAQLSALLEPLGESADRFVAGGLALWASVDALWTFLRPDDARLRLLPLWLAKLLPGGAALLLVFLVAACATTPQGRYVQAAQTWNSVARGYNAFLAMDNARYSSCLRGDTPDECRPILDPQDRAAALSIIERADALLDELELLVEQPNASDAAVTALLDQLAGLTLELEALYTQEE